MAHDAREVFDSVYKYIHIYIYIYIDIHILYNNTANCREETTLHIRVVSLRPIRGTLEGEFGATQKK